MKEIPLQFGTHRHLVGTLTLPTSTPQSDTAFVLMGAGVIHRIGPHRINVKLARHLATMGFASIRFDLSGQGDSSNAQGNLGYAQQAVADIQAAMDHLARTLDVHRFALAGICSGAFNSFATAQVDARVCGLFLIDGQHYPTWKTQSIGWLRRMKGPVWKMVAPWLWQRAKKLASKSSLAEQAAAANGGWSHPAQDIYAQAMQALCAREVRICLLFSGSLLRTYNYAGQFKDAFAGQGFVDKISVQYCPDIDHTITPLGAQQNLLERVGAWAKQPF
jgi:pimeloyl-ACP methyl ester carboxylesterase